MASDNAIIPATSTGASAGHRALQLRLPAQGEGVGRRRLLAESDSSRRAADDVGAGEGNHGRRRRARHGVLYFDRRGNLQHQLARVVVVCCNGIGTPRLLLASKSKRFPDGLANSTGNVGGIS